MLRIFMHMDRPNSQPPYVRQSKTRHVSLSWADILTHTSLGPVAESSPQLFVV